jgi:HlyD family secretion protein
VWVLAGGKPKRVPVATGVSDGSFTEIVSGDLKEGQEVLVDTAAKTRKTDAAHRMF